MLFARAHLLASMCNLCKSRLAKAATLLCFPESPALNVSRLLIQGYRTLLSSPWYLNLGGFASNDWQQYYAVEPLGFQGSEEQRRLVIGGEVISCTIIRQDLPQTGLLH